MRPTNFWTTINQFINNSAKNSAYQMLPFAIFGFVAFPAFYVLDHFIAPEPVNVLILRIIASLLCLLLVLKNYWPQKLIPFLPYYWYFTLLYCLPFFFSYMLLRHHLGVTWLLHSVTIVFLLMLLVDWISFFVLLILGAACGVLAYVATTPVPQFALPSAIHPMEAISNYIVILVMGLFFARNKQQHEYEKMQSMQSVSASIAHELRTPLAGISLGMSGLKRYLPNLIKGYRLARKAHFTVEPIRQVYIDYLQQLAERVDKEIQYANTFISMFLIKANENLSLSAKLEICSLTHCVEEALARYPFTDSEKGLLIWERPEQDLKVFGVELLIVHILFNLIKNALFFIRENGRGEITLWLESGEAYNELHCKDTAQGIAAHILPYLFEQFYSRRVGGTGIGLAFCKRVMTSFEGDIRCESIEGEYTEFILQFPLIPSSPVDSR